jgi:hypothetical protein
MADEKPDYMLHNTPGGMAGVKNLLIFGKGKIKRLFLPGASGSLVEITATAEEINALNLTTRKFTVYSAVALAKGDLLHITGYNVANDVFTVEKADADTSGKPAQLIASEINGGSETSLASDIEELTGLNTNAGEVGDPVYLDAATAGSWTLTGPTGTDQLKQIVGRIKVKSATVGKIVFNTVKAEVVALGSSALQPDSVTKTKLAGGFSQISLLAGGAAGDHVISGIAVGDELVKVLHISTAASVVTIADLTSEFTVAAGKITNAEGTDTSDDQLLVFWNDLT